MVICALVFLSLGLEKKSTSVNIPLIITLAEIRLAWQLDSGKAELDDEWTVQVCPKSLVTDTALPLLAPFSVRFRSSLMFSIKEPSFNSTTCDSVVLDFAPVPTDHVLP